MAILNIRCFELLAVLNNGPKLSLPLWSCWISRTKRVSDIVLIFLLTLNIFHTFQYLEPTPLYKGNGKFDFSIFSRKGRVIFISVLSVCDLLINTIYISVLCVSLEGHIIVLLNLISRYMTSASSFWKETLIFVSVSYSV